MGKIVFINLLDGNFENGFSVFLQIWTEGERRLIATAKGKLPPSLKLYEHYNLWQLRYRSHVSGRYSARVNVEGATDTSIKDEIRQAGKQLEFSLNDWLKPNSQFGLIRETLLTNLKDESEEIRVIFDTDSLELQRLPWHLWSDFFKRYYRAEVALSLPVIKRQKVPLTNQVRVLAIFGKRETFGNATRIMTDKDWEMLKQFLVTNSNAKLLRLEQPSLENLCEQIYQQKPQILFFAGHSHSEEDGDRGFINLNDEEIITIDNLEPDLRRAVSRGLQLAIFNSCDGFGIARQLAQMHVPNIIVMREPVPDEVAQKFLQRFLEAFAAGKPLHLAVRRARERINYLENKFPGATWLPMTFQDSSEPPLSWKGLGGVEIKRESPQEAAEHQEPQTVTKDSIPWLTTTINPHKTEEQQPTKKVSNHPEVSSTPKIKDTHPKAKQDTDNWKIFRFIKEFVFYHVFYQLIKKILVKSEKRLVKTEFFIVCPTCSHQNPPGAVQCQACYTPLTHNEQSKEISNQTSVKTEQFPEENSTKELTFTTEIGYLLGGRYRVSRNLAAGGFSCTYLAEDTQRPGQPICVVKQLRSFTQNPQVLDAARRLFNNEAKILELLGRDDRIPQLLAYFEENQQFYLVQEFISGHTLDQEINSGKIFGESQVVQILKEVLLILYFVHSHGVIHRDIKPGNLIRREQDEKIVLIDFGAVKYIQNQYNEEISAETIAIGTLGYAPPEQLLGNPRLNSDIYALGMIGIQALTGKSPRGLERDHTGVLLWHDLVKNTVKIAKILDKMVCYDFSQRYQSVTEVLRDLEL